MNQQEITNLLLAINRLHQTSARYIKTEQVKETFDDEMVWDGEVAVFELLKHPSSKTAYAWSSPIEGSEKRKFYAVLKEGPIKTPTDAVRAAVVRDYQEGLNA